MRLFPIIALMLAGCGSVTAPPPPPRPALQELLAEKKFQPIEVFYTGVDTPEDQAPLEQAVDSAIEDVTAMPEPLDKRTALSRLSKLIDDTDSFATEDREEVYRYVVRIWRAAGFQEETNLFGVSDDMVL